VSVSRADEPQLLFANPVWRALHGQHREFALCAGEACRYPTDVAPFAALATPSVPALRQLRSLLTADESVWLFGSHAARAAQLHCVERLECLQMLLAEDVAAGEPTLEVQHLSAADSAAMVELTALAFPGFFRARTCEMGTYYGIFDEGVLVAMGGERLMLEGYAEISGVCTRPQYRGRGYARELIWQLVRDHRRRGWHSWLHVSVANAGATALYTSMGFKPLRVVTLERLRREE
jgi:ribosomal protein S18 acetylase RimI-like enzyme